jgi:hypothetical protein
MTRGFKIALFTTFVLLALGGYFLLWVQYAVRDVGSDVQQVAVAILDGVVEAAKPLLEAEVFARYDAATETFSVHTRTAPDEPTRQLSETQLSELITAASPTRPGVVILYQEADFPEPAQREEFESRVRGELEEAGASAVTFGMEGPADGKSPFERPPFAPPGRK